MIHKEYDVTALGGVPDHHQTGSLEGDAGEVGDRIIISRRAGLWQVRIIMM